MEILLDNKWIYILPEQNQEGEGLWIYISNTTENINNQSVNNNNSVILPNKTRITWQDQQQDSQDVSDSATWEYNLPGKESGLPGQQEEPPNLVSASPSSHDALLIDIALLGDNTSNTNLQSVDHSDEVATTPVIGMPKPTTPGDSPKESQGTPETMTTNITNTTTPTAMTQTTTTSSLTTTRATSLNTPEKNTGKSLYP